MRDPITEAPDDRAELLVVDDEQFLRDAVAASLRFLGFTVTTAESGAGALRLARDHPFDLIVLDVMLPDTDGFEVVRLLRRDGARTPVIFLTARDAPADKVNGLTLGGDDYITKPFGLEELAARIRTVLRRTRPSAPGAVLSFADVELDQETYEVRRAGRLLELSPTEYRLLRFLMLNPTRVLTRAQLLDHVWDYDFEGSSTVVATYVAYLRRKLCQHGPDLIHTRARRWLQPARAVGRANQWRVDGRATSSVPVCWRGSSLSRSSRSPSSTLQPPPSCVDISSAERTRRSKRSFTPVNRISRDCSVTRLWANRVGLSKWALGATTISPSSPLTGRRSCSVRLRGSHRSCRRTWPRSLRAAGTRPSARSTGRDRFASAHGRPREAPWSRARASTR